MKRFTQGPVFWLLFGLACVYALWYAWYIRWTCDDVFITLRYIGHWFRGEGIVYNAGEYVEGYTHFLWLLLLAGAGKLGIDMMQASMLLGWISFAGLLFLSAWRAWRIRLFVPLGALYLCFHHDMAVWATGGLETLFYALLFYAAFWVRFQARISYRNKLWATGILCGLAILTRPDAALLLVWVGLQELVILIWARSSFKTLCCRLFQLGIFPLLLVGPWLWWKYTYYGDILPNTYYAKSGGLSYFSQGWDYLDSYARAYVSVYLMLASGLVGIVAGAFKKGGERSPERVPLAGQSLSVLLFVAVYAVVFVAKSGGDYMYARFVIPLIPLVAMLPENTLAIFRLNTSAWRVRTAVLVLAVGWAGFVWVENGFRESLFTDSVTGEGGKKWKGKIYDSHAHHRLYYPSEKYRALGEELNPVFAGTSARVLNFGDCCLCYYADFYYVLENFGLTDAYIAHKPLAKREVMVGHEKYAEREYMDKQRIQFCFNGPDFLHTSLSGIRFVSATGDTLKGDMLRYEYGLMDTLEQRAGNRLQFTDAYDWFNGLLAQKETLGADSVRKAYRQYWGYYFGPNAHVPQVREQEEAIRRFLGEPGTASHNR